MKIGSCLPIVFSQVIYSGGYSDGEPPLPIPNREAKPVIADGTARPGGRVGSRRALKESSDERSSGDSFFVFIPVRGKAVHDIRIPVGMDGVFSFETVVRGLRTGVFVLVLPLSPQHGHVCGDERLSFDPLDRRHQ